MEVRLSTERTKCNVEPRAAHVFEASGLYALAKSLVSNSCTDYSSELSHFIDWAVLIDG